MGFDALSKMKQAVEDWRYKWEGKSREGRKSPASAEAEIARRRQEKNAFLSLISARLTGTSSTEMPALRCETDGPSSRAVFLVTMPIAFGALELSMSTYKLLAKHVGMSLDSVSHWAVCVVDRGFGPSYCYDLMSDQMMLNALGKNYFRVNEVTPELVRTWNSCYYVGETTKSHNEIQELGQNHTALNPRYRLVTNNCQDLVESLVKQLCNGRTISQAKLSEELSMASPKIALDLMVARLKSRLDTKGEHEDSDAVKADVDAIKGLHRTVTEREQKP